LKDSCSSTCSTTSYLLLKEQPTKLPGEHPDTAGEICFDEAIGKVDEELRQQPLAERGQDKEVRAELPSAAAANADRPDNRPFQEEPDDAGLKGVGEGGKQEERGGKGAAGTKEAFAELLSTSQRERICFLKAGGSRAEEDEHHGAGGGDVQEAAAAAAQGDHQFAAQHAEADAQVQRDARAGLRGALLLDGALRPAQY